MSKVVLVTGGSRGIGAAACRLAARDGWDVAVNYGREKEAAQAVAAQVQAAGRRAVVLQGDVRDEETVLRLFEQTEEALGPITGLVNSAGITGRISKLMDAPAEEMRRTLDINVMGTLLCCREAVRRMARSRGGQGGSIVNLSSRAAKLGSPNEFVWYAASKGAIDSLTLGLAREAGPEGIRVNAVAPGLILTDIHAAAGDAGRVERLTAGVPLGRPGSAEESAEPIAWLLSDAASYISGTVIDAGAGR
ncbi:MAG TPA: SDR family oxidoreductase [Kiloniellales bacterium]|nr:SDR family oxidoreductase [Kiloniellales bacterium]